MSWDDPDDKPRSRRWRSVNLAGPLILITLGLLFLGANLGVLGASPWELLWQWWPLILIGIGLEVLLGLLGRWSRALSAAVGLAVVAGAVALAAYMLTLGPRAAAGEPAYTSRLVQERGDVGRAEIVLDLSLGTFRVSALTPDSGNLAEAQFTGSGGRDSDSPPVQREYRETGGVAALTLKSSGPQVRVGHSAWPAWRLRLAPDLPLALTLDAVLGTYDLDLRDLQVTSLDVDGVMASQTIYVPAQGRVLVRVEGVMESVELVVPAGVAARIHTQGLAAIQIDGQRFPRRGDVNESAGFDTATDRVEITIEAVMSSVRVR